MTIVHEDMPTMQAAHRLSPRLRQEQLRAEIQAALPAVVTRSMEEQLEKEVDTLLGRERYQRRKKQDRRWVQQAHCCKCGTHNARRFRRNGHYGRYLDTDWGRVRLRMPQLECTCGGMVHVDFQSVRPRQRLWGDLEAQIRERAGKGESLRSIKEQVDQRAGGSVGLRTLNQRVHAVAPLVPLGQQEWVQDVPPVVYVDGLWVTLMQETRQRRTDRLGRQRVVKRARKVPVLVAQGVWPEQNRREVLGWIVASGEDEASWEALLTQLEQRGVRPERGLVLLVADGSAGLTPARETVWWDVAFQRCVFHKLRNVWRAMRVPEELQGKAARAFKRRFIRSAARIWRAPTEREARKRLRAFRRKWQERQPQAIATLERDVEDTLTFYRVQAAAAQRGQHWPAHHLRTTSPLERELRAFRQRMRQAVLWHSRTGLEAQVQLLLVRRKVKRTNPWPGAWVTVLEHELARLESIS